MSAVRVLGALLFVSCQTVNGTPADRDPSRGILLRPRSVLFVGNSLTYVNDLPHLTQAFAAANPLHASLTVWSVVSGGAPLSELWRSGEVVRMLRLHRPDVLVLQGQSTEPLAAQSDFFLHAELLKTEADKIGARTILFETWARPPGDDFYSRPESGGSPAVMQRRLDDTYEWLANQLDAEVSRVGESFEGARARLPDVPLLDGTQHPTVAGSYLAAAVLFQSLFHASPLETTFTAGLPELSAIALQRAAVAAR